MTKLKDVHDKPQLMLMIAYFVSVITMIAVGTIEPWFSPWIIVFGAEAIIACLMLAYREKQLEKEKNKYEYKHL